MLEYAKRMAPSNSSRYLIRTLVRAADLLSTFHDPSEVLRLRDVVSRTGLDKNTAFRMLYTLHHCGFLEKSGTGGYRCTIRLNKRRKWRIGYASGGDTSLFNKEITEGFMRAAEQHDIELVLMDNRYSPTTALRVIDRLIKERVDLIVEYQSDYAIAPKIAARCSAENIPLIAVEIPHPGATYFGANNYAAGLIGGHHLGMWARQHWQGSIDAIILVEQRRAGPLAQSRLMGTLKGIEGVLPHANQCQIVYLDGDSDLGRSHAVVHNHLRFSTVKRTLVAGLDDICTLGALRAFEEAGRAECCAVMGQNGSPEARMELRRPGTRLIGSVGYFPEKYGEGLMRLVLSLVEKKPIPSAVFIKHRLITRENVNHLYPNDALIGYAPRV